MARAYIPVDVDRRVRAAANNRCGYCLSPQHLVMAATRYDPNAYLIVDVDTKAMTHRLVNLGLVDWNTHFSKPFVG